MPRRIARHLTYANVMATAAVFIALGGSASAAFIITSNSQIGPGTVSGAKPPAGDGPNIIAGSIFTSDLAPSAVASSKLASNSVSSSKVKNGALLGVDLAADTVTGTQVDESTLGTVPSATNAAELGGVGPAGYQVALSGSCSSGSAVGGISAGVLLCNHNHVRPGIANLTLGGITLASQRCAIIEIPLSGMAIGDTAIMVPDAATWPAGLIYQVLRADQTSKVPLDVCNPTKATVGSPVVHLSIWEVKLTP